MINMELSEDKLFETANSDFSLTPNNLVEKSLCEPGIALKWLRVLCSAQKKLKVLKDTKDKRLKERYIGFVDPVLPRIAKEKQILESDEFQNYEKQIQELSEIVQFLTGIYSIAAKLGFSIKNATELFKIEKMG